MTENKSVRATERKSAGKNVAKAEEAKLPAASATYDYGQDAGVGFEGIESKDLSIPFMNILQKNSPEVENADDTGSGAKPGMFINTVTQELLTSFVFCPVHREEAFVEWVPRALGGGFVGLHDPHSELVQEVIKANGGSRIPPKGEDGKRINFRHGKNELIETYYLYGLTLTDDGSDVTGFCVLSFSSTKIKPYRNFTSSMFMLRGKPPMFANRARVGTIKQQNEAGSYFNFDIRPLRSDWTTSLINPAVEGGIIESAKAFRDMVLAGRAKADYARQETADTADGETPF
jgi:hypothetical protein